MRVKPRSQTAPGACQARQAEFCSQAHSCGTRGRFGWLHEREPVVPHAQGVTSVWPRSVWLPLHLSGLTSDSIQFLSSPFPTCPDAFWVPPGSLVKVSRTSALWFSPDSTEGLLESLKKTPVTRLHPRPATSDLGGQDLGVNSFFLSSQVIPMCSQR